VDKFNPTHIFVNTKLSKYIRKHSSFESAHEYGAGSIHTAGRTDLREAGIIGQIYGMQVVTSPNVYESTSYANDDTFLVADAEYAANIVDKRPLTVRQHDIPEEDEVWLIGSARMAPAVLKADALSGKTDCLSPS
jgi:hypothetical protein